VQTAPAELNEPRIQISFYAVVTNLPRKLALHGFDKYGRPIGLDKNVPSCPDGVKRWGRM
jgi:hypothetical protein